MKQRAWEEIKRLIRHGIAPLVAILVAGGHVSGDGSNFVNAVLVVVGVVFSVGWSFLRAQFPWIRWL